MAELPYASPAHKEVGEVMVLPPADVMQTLGTVRGRVQATILDPWYNKGTGGHREDYDEWVLGVVSAARDVSEHIFLWGFPEITARIVDRLPRGVELVAWLTWYYKNCPSVIRGWRSSQLACLHLARPGARLHPEHFMNEGQRRLQKEGKLRYMPGPPSVIEEPLLVGFVGRNEQTGHPAQKPVGVIEPLVLMATEEGDALLDPMCGSGTTGVVCARLHRRAVLCDHSEEFTAMTEQRLGVQRCSRPASALRRWGLA